jgi:hypothetical protein
MAVVGAEVVAKELMEPLEAAVVSLALAVVVTQVDLLQSKVTQEEMVKQMLVLVELRVLVAVVQEQEEPTLRVLTLVALVALVCRHPLAAHL